MGQRINIQYSVDIDDLDTEVRRLMADAHKRYSSLEDIYDNGRDTVLSNEALERVDRIRLELAAMDHRLNDVVNIIAGYLHYKAQQNNMAAQDVNMPRDDDLESRIEEFKGMTDTLDGNEVPNQGK